jgi:signal transduction histidine kinase
LSEARRSIWNLQATPTNNSTLTDAINAACEQILFGHDAKLHLAIRGKPWKANPFAEHSLLRITQEAVSNAIRHGHAREIRIEQAYEFTRLVFTITDDGSGYEETATRVAAHRGYGLQSMRRRADSIRAVFHVHSAIGVGTCVEVIVPRTRFIRAGRSPAARAGGYQ